jgi:LemA protein
MNNKGKTGLIVVGIIVVVVIAAAAGYFNLRNELVVLDEGINSAWSEIDNQLQRRSDLIPNLVATVKGYATHEEEVYTKIADARSRLAGAKTVDEKAAGYNDMQSALSRLLVVVENYPVLQANQNFIRLQDELAGSENRLAVARMRYNDSVKVFNTRIRSFPDSLVAGGMGFAQKTYFEIEKTARQAPKVDFGKPAN